MKESEIAEEKAITAEEIDVLLDDQGKPWSVASVPKHKA